MWWWYVSKKTEKFIDPAEIKAKVREIKDVGITIPLEGGKTVILPDIKLIEDEKTRPHIRILKAIEKELMMPDAQATPANASDGPLSSLFQPQYLDKTEGTRQFAKSNVLGEPFLNEPQNAETKALFESLLPVQGEQMEQITEIGTGIPYYTAMIGDMLLNPSTVDILTFKKMMETDDVIYHALDYNGSSIVNSIGNYTHKNKDIEELVQYTFDNLRRGFSQMIKDMNMAVGLGFSIHSLLWEYNETIGGNIIADVYPLPQSTIVFRVQPDGHILEDGVGQYVYNAYLQNVASAASLGWWRGAMDDPSNAPFPLVPSISLDPLASGGDLDFPFRIPWYSPVGLIWLKRKNVMHYKHYGTTAQMNPYGRSALRAIYNIWLQSMAIQQFKMVALNRRSFPLLLVYCNQTTPTANVNPSNPEITLHRPTSAIDAAATILSDVNSVSTVLLPGMEGQIYKVEAIKVEGNMDIFEKLEKDLNDRKKITLGVPPNLMASGDGASFALAYMQGQSNSRIVASSRTSILDCLLDQFVKPLIQENFTEEDYENCDWGQFEDEQISTDERVKNAGLYDIGIKNKILSPARLDDLNTMREGMGFPRISQDEFEEYKKELLDFLDKLQETTQEDTPDGPSATPDKRDRNDSIEKPYEHESNVPS